MLPHDRQQPQRHVAGAFGAGFPFLYGAFAGVEIARTDRLVDAVSLAKLPTLSDLELGQF